MCILHIMVLSLVSFNQRKPAVVAPVPSPPPSGPQVTAVLLCEEWKGWAESAAAPQRKVLGVQNYLSASLVCIHFWLPLKSNFQHLLLTQPHTSPPVWGGNSYVDRIQVPELDMLNCNSACVCVISRGLLVTQILTKLERESLPHLTLHQNLVQHSCSWFMELHDFPVKSAVKP